MARRRRGGAARGRRPTVSAGVDGASSFELVFDVPADSPFSLAAVLSRSGDETDPVGFSASELLLALDGGATVASWLCDDVLGSDCGPLATDGVLTAGRYRLFRARASSGDAIAGRHTAAFSFDLQVVPEPATAPLLLATLGLLAAQRWRVRRAPGAAR